MRSLLLLFVSSKYPVLILCRSSRILTTLLTTLKPFVLLAPRCTPLHRVVLTHIILPTRSCPLDIARTTSSTKLGRSVANNLCFRTLFSFSMFVFLFVFCFSVSVSLFFMFLCSFPSPLGQHDSFTAARCRLQFAVCSFRPVAF